MRRELILAVALCGAMASAAHARGSKAEEAPSPCGPLVSPDPQRITPMDYRLESPRLAMVETYHFTRNVEFLVKPIFQNFGSSIAYTLHGYPNHIRALATLVRLGEREKTNKPAGADYTIDCYFDRALRFTPDDHVVRMLYADYLGKKGRREDAVRMADVVDTQAADDPLTRRNLGLLYLELAEPQKASAQLGKADPQDLAMVALRQALERRGVHLPAQPASAASAAPVTTTH